MVTVPTTLRELTLPTSIPFDVEFPLVDITDQLIKHPQGDWLTQPTMRANGKHATGPRDYRSIKRFSIHHTGVKNGTVQGHARYHVNSLGRPGICYHLYANAQELYQLNDLLSLTWHTASNNYDTIGICLEGDFTQRDMTDIERKSLYALILTGLHYFPWVRVEDILGHNEFPGQTTSCPGFDMKRVRKDIKELAMEMEYRKSAAYRTTAIVELKARVDQLYAMFQQKSEFWTDAERKLFTMYKLSEDYELMDPMKSGKPYL